MRSCVFAALAIGAIAQVPSLTPGSVAKFKADSIIVLRSGSGGTLTAANGVPLQVVEYSPTGNALQTIDVPQTTTSSGYRCVVGHTANFYVDTFIQRSFDGEGCNDYRNLHMSLVRSVSNASDLSIVPLLARRKRADVSLQ